MKPVHFAARVTLPAPKETVRSLERRNLAIAIELFDAARFSVALTGNISEGGVFVTGAPRHAVGAMVHVRFTLPGDARPIMVATEVRWAKDAKDVQGACALGLRFVRVKPEDLVRIREFVRGARANRTIH